MGDTLGNAHVLRVARSRVETPLTKGKARALEPDRVPTDRRSATHADPCSLSVRAELACLPLTRLVVVR